jgi:hypothetical protein
MKPIQTGEDRPSRNPPPVNEPGLRILSKTACCFKRKFLGSALASAGGAYENPDLIDEGRDPQADPEGPPVSAEDDVV